VEALLGAADAPRDRLLLGLGLFCGLRVSELCKLEAPDLDLGAGQLLVREGKGGKDRTVPLPSRLVEELRGWLGGRTVGLVFPSPRKAGRPLTTRAVQLLIKRVAAKANIPGALEARKVHPHRLRHSFATRLLRSGADIIEVRDLLGHSSVGTTQVYLSADTTRLRSAVERAAGGG
jgi:integrase